MEKESNSSTPSQGNPLQCVIVTNLVVIHTVTVLVFDLVSWYHKKKKRKIKNPQDVQINFKVMYSISSEESAKNDKSCNLIIKIGKGTIEVSKQNYGLQFSLC